MRRAVVWTVAVLAVAGAVVVAGLPPLTASSGHWAITAWVLDFAKVRSVTTHALTIDAPSLDDPSLVQLGRRSYARGCQPCHGHPGAAPPVVPARMTPHPPSLAAQVGRWRARELFYIVRHGIKFTGMPAWPALDREDEVWAVVAYLRTLPAVATRDAGLEDAEETVVPTGEPGALAPGLAPASIYAARCAWCHGPRGEGRADARIPRLAGQRRGYLALTLRAYADGARPSGVMQPPAAQLSPRDIDALAGWLAAADPWPSSSAASPAPLTHTGDAVRGIPACDACHDDDAARIEDYPRLRGLPAAYLATQLDLFARGRRGGSRYADIMRTVARRLTAEQREAAVRAYADERSGSHAP